METYKLWVAEQPPQAIVDVYRWATAHDPVLLRAMQRRQPTRDAMMLAAEDALLRHGEPSETVIGLIVMAATSGDPIAMTFGFPTSVTRLLGSIRDDRRRARMYTDLVHELAPSFGGEANRHVRRGGWPYLLCTAGSNAFIARDPVAAVQHSDEAWRYAEELPEDVRSAGGIVQIVRLYVSALCHWPEPRGPEWVDTMNIALDRVTVAREMISRFGPSAGVARGLAELGISEAHLWYVLRRKHVVPFHLAERRRLDALDQALTDLDIWLPEDEAEADTPTNSRLPSGRPIPQQLRAVVAHVLDKIATVTAELGLSQRSEEAVKLAIELCETPTQLADSLLNGIRADVNVEQRIHRFELLFRHLDAGHFDELNSRQRDRLSVRLASACLDLSKVLYRTKRPTAAWFWERQADALRRVDALRPDSAVTAASPVPQRAPQWDPPAAEDELDDDELDLSETAVIDDLTTGVDEPKSEQAVAHSAVDPRERLADAVRRQHVVAIVLNLMHLPKSGSPLTEVIETLTAVENWHPPERVSRTGRLKPTECSTPDEVERAALELADEFAVNYASWLRPQLLNNLARSAEVIKAGTARPAAQEAFVSAIRTGRWNEAVRAQQFLLADARQRGDGVAMADAVRAMSDLVQSAIISARGTADLIDIARAMTKASTSMACSLAKWGQPNLAFNTAISSLGALNRIFLDTPGLAEEFELAEQFSQRQPTADEQLLFLMRKRLTRPLPPVAQEPAETAEMAAAFGPSTSFVQLLGTAQGGYWALGHSVTPEGIRSWSVSLAVTSQYLDQLRRAVWFELRPTRRNARSVNALRKLYEVVVEPLQPHLGDTDDIVVIPHQGFAGLPVHAALGPEGHLIERHRVSYMPNLAKPAAAPAGLRRALVAGWDPEISAGVEAYAVTRQLKALGFEVAKPDKAARGRRELLEPDQRWHVVHIAAHGDFQSWPASMASRLRLSPSVAVTAGEWLRSGCRATFAFTNACSVGRHTPHAGDLNGFPLALRARGVVSEISALAPVPAVGGKQFAHLFYGGWAGQDSLTAYQQACLATIAAGGRPCDWAPYVHGGTPLPLDARSARPPHRRDGARAGRRWRKK
ncbi:CHAT domain-containing protein [Actinoplanes xinjiangensis]|uniref:CHAT domain-containing protein n=1 Tax=Actinoplanes xinjiangensis TaxID=512350 RepID=A0A316F520_9ACTN|nr:CHAT domain-containing protein [Actinoplanes xinjiangensis]PWK39471.1 CHAT domain-containing protein [Actinoplanes xinjiangensis]